MEIRAATAGDLEDVACLLRAQLDEHSIALPDDALRAAIRGAIDKPARGAFLVARDPDPVGVAYLSYVWTLEHGGQSAWLEELYVVPPMRCRGIGRRLLCEVMAHATRAGCRAVDLEVEQDHARAANLYAREGFRPHRRARWVAPL
jgi:ribosomal protein S18 acetylase RimI-like enzyme